MVSSVTPFVFENYTTQILHSLPTYDMKMMSFMKCAPPPPPIGQPFELFHCSSDEAQNQYWGVITVC